MSAVEDAVCNKIQGRASVGLNKYGTTMEREDFSKLDWLMYAQEEAMDLVVYLQKLIELEVVTEENEYNVIKTIAHDPVPKMEE